MQRNVEIIIKHLYFFLKSNVHSRNESLMKFYLNTE